jgi:ketosteroid isomerase-like protein
MTRTGVMFSALEKSLDAAARNKDQAGLAKLLSEDFELRESATPGQPVPRADWLARAGGAGTMALSQVGVHDFGDTAVVSFSMSGAHGMAAGSTIFVVDVWHRVNGQWQLAVRFQPTSGSATETGDVKPDGKG